MEIERTYFRCDLCGNLITMLTDSGVVPDCCGQPMRLLTANTTDAAKEKHVPELKRDGDSLTVTIGSVPHPMTEEHYIEWIALSQEHHGQRAVLNPGDAPQAVFACNPGPLIVYAYCNLHGLWANELK